MKLYVLLLLPLALLASCTVSDDARTTEEDEAALQIDPDTLSMPDYDDTLPSIRPNPQGIPTPQLDVAEMQTEFGLSTRQVDQLNELNRWVAQKVDSLVATGIDERRKIDNALEDIELERESRLEDILNKEQYLEYFKKSR